jgi:hypothetical protein
VGDVLSGAVPQQVQRRIVSDAKQPSLWMRDRSRLGQCLQRFDDRLMQDVLALKDRAGHTGAVTMQFWPQFADEPVEGLAVQGLAGSNGAHGPS